MRLERDFVLLARISILRLHLADLLKGEHRLLHLAKRHIRLALSVMTFHVVRVTLDCLTCIEKCKLVLFQFETGERTIAVQDSFLFTANLAENSLCVLLSCVLEFLCYSKQQLRV